MRPASTAIAALKPPPSSRTTNDVSATSICSRLA
jgi:hypothetical protein